jgi:Multiubiquitin
VTDETTSTAPDASVAAQARFEVNIEGGVHPWDSPTITVPELRALGGLPADQPVLEINLKDNTEHTLNEDEIVELKPGHGFAKKVQFKRG